MRGSFRLGMTFRLFAGLIAMAVLTVAAIMMAMVSFESFRKGFDQVASQQMETMVVAAQLGQQSETIIGHAPTLLLAQTDWQRLDVAFVAADQQAWLGELVQRLAKTLEDRAAIDAIEANKLALVENINALDQQVARRIQSEAGLRQALEQFRMAHAQTLELIDARSAESMRDARAAEPAGGRPLVEGLDQAVDLLAVNTIAAIAVRHPAQSATLQAEAARHLTHFGDLLGQLGAGPFADAMRASHARLRALLTGEEGLFPLLARTEAYRSESQALMEANRDIAAVLTTSIGNLMSVVRSDILQKNQYFNQILATRSQLLTLIAGLCVLAAVAIAGYIHFSVIRRLNLLQHCIRAQLAGNPVPFPTDGRDEIGEMARAVDYFVTEIRRREQALRESESRFRGLIEGSIQGIMIHRDFKPLFANESYARYFGFASSDEFLMLPTLEPLLAPEELAGARDNYERLMAGEVRLDVLRVKNRRKDGSTVWLDVFDRVVDWMGERAVQVTVVDVTDHVRAESEAAEKTAQLEAAFDAMPSGICMFDKDLDVVVHNQLFIDLWGGDRAFLNTHGTLPALLRHAVAVGTPEGGDVEATVASLLSSIRSSDRVTFEVHLSDDRSLEIRSSRRPQGGFVFTYADVTERKRAEEARRASEARFRDLIVGSIQGMIIDTFDGQILFANQAIADIIGYDSPDEVVAAGSILNLVVPEDRERIQAYAHARQHGLPVPSRYRCRGLRRDGSTIWLDTIVRSIEWLGQLAAQTVIVDVTAEVRAEATATEKTAQLEAAFDAMPNGICMFDSDLRVAIFNKKYAELWRYPPDLLKPGVSLPDLVRFTVPWRRDAHTIDVEGTVADAVRVFRHQASMEEAIRLADGRVIEIKGNRRPDGGYVYTYTDVTERKRAEQALRDSEERLDLAIMATRAAVWDVDLMAGEVWWSPQYYELLGHGPDEIHPETGTWNGLVHPDDHDGAEALAKRYLAGRADHYRAVYRIRHRDGTWLWVEDYGRAMWDEQGRPLRFVGVMLDITARKRAEDELARKSAILEATLENMDQGIVMTAPGDHILAYNRRVIELFQVPDERTIEGVIRGHLDRSGDGAAAAPLSDRPAVGELPLSDGRYLEVRSKPTPGGGFVRTYTDVTERRRNEEALRLAKEQAEDATRAKSTFLATMSHEIRTPMNGVLGMLEILQRSSLDFDQRKVVGVIRESASALLTIIDDILDFSKIEAGRLSLETVPLSVLETVEGVADLMATRAREKSLDLVTHILPGTPDMVLGDPVRLRQILLNLVGNAAKFTENGYVAVVVGIKAAVEREADKAYGAFATADEVDRLLPPAGGDGGVGGAGGAGTPVMLRLEVRDTGIGMTQEQMARLFQPFTQADASTTRRFGGSGLGLSICSRLVALMGGRIGVRGAIGEGSVFWFEVPLSLAQGPRRLPQIDLADIDVLVVDDIGVAGDALQAMLTGAGARAMAVATAAAGFDALRKAARRGHPFAAAIINHDPGVVDGLGLARALSKMPELAGTRIIITTHLDEPGVATAAERLGVVAVLYKPVRQEALLTAVATAVGRMALEPLAGQDDAGDMRLVEPPSVEEALDAGVLILVAEDNPTNQVVIRSQLHKLGFAAELAENGAEAWQGIGRKKYGLLLTDCFMPEMDGYALAVKVREAERATGERLPIVALTASALTGEAERCYAAGMDDYLTKPVNMKSLHRTIARWLPKAIEMRKLVATAKVDVQATPHPPAAPAGSAPWERTDGAPILDREHVVALFGSLDQAKDLLMYFLETTAPLLAEVEIQLGMGDAVGTRGAAHAAAGAARTAGAVELGAICTEIEVGALEGNLVAQRDKLPALMAAFARVEQVICHEL